jgi:signal transduction histidine kinase
MIRMIKSLLDTERLEAHEAALERQPVSLRNLLCEAADLVSALAHESEQRLSLELDDRLPEVAADHDMLVRVVTNLLENAIKHTPTGGSIILSATTEEDGVRISVTDNGPGIPAPLHREVFDKYVRVKGERKREGYGLGLAFCRLAIEAHGGHIWVENGSNGGAVFVFRLPVVRNAMVA